MGCSSTITGRQHEGGAADPDAGVLLGGISLPGVSGPEADDRGALVVACPHTIVGGLGPQRVDIGVGFVRLLFTDDGAAGEEVTIRQDHRPYGSQLAAMLCFLIFADNVLGRIEAHEETVWFWLSSGRGELILVSGVLSIVCQLLFWSGVVRTGHRGTRGE